MAIDILRALRTPEEYNLTAESLVDGLQNLVKSATQVISTWKELKAAVIFTVSVFFANTANVSDTFSISNYLKTFKLH